MNPTLKTVLLTVLTLSAFTLAMLEISGVSTKAVINKWKGDEETARMDPKEEAKLDSIVAKMQPTTCSVSDSVVELGQIIAGEKRTAVYSIKNTGTAPLRLSNVVTSCGCTAPTFPKYLVAPGDSAAIELVFNSAGKDGEVRKSAMIKCNTSNAPFSVAFHAVVKPKTE
jgi:hypothetical protein